VKMADLLELSMANLWRTKLRTTLTTLGVVVGIGALVSMVSFGTGMQKNVTQSFKENDLFTSMNVTPQKIDIAAAMSGDIEEIIEESDKNAIALNDSSLNVIAAIPEVDIVFPEISFPVKLRFRDSDTKSRLKALPAEMGQYKPFNKMAHGQFFTSDTTRGVVLAPRILRELKIRIKETDGKQKALSFEDSLKGFRTLPVDSIIGQNIQISTSVVDVQSMLRNPFAHLMPSRNMPFKEETVYLRIIGILERTSGFEANRFVGGVMVPMKIAEEIPHLGFNSVWEILGKKQSPDSYASLYVRVKKSEDQAAVQKQIENMGFGVFSFANELEEIKKAFLIVDAALGAVGVIALFVAALGIINTMVMSILERTREIGIMKAIGGSETEIKTIFFFEAGCIGFLGGVFGLVLGWLVTRVANLVMNHYIVNNGGYEVELFYIPVWLILGAMGFSILISLLAGLYPAVRAARVNPVEALRHD